MDPIVDGINDDKRGDKSLGLLARKFVSLIKRATDGTLDLKNVSFS